MTRVWTGSAFVDNVDEPSHIVVISVRGSRAPVVGGFWRWRPKTDASPHLHHIIVLPPLASDVAEVRRHRVSCACGVSTCSALPAGAPTAACRTALALLGDVFSVDVSFGVGTRSPGMEQLRCDGMTGFIFLARIRSRSKSES
jgi:hypothetical protein